MTLDEPEPRTPNDVSARRLLVEWANEHDPWVRLIAGQVLVQEHPLDEAALDAAFEQYLSERGLSDTPTLDVAALELDASALEDNSVLRLSKLANIRGVNALAEDQAIEFNPSLTVIFGENGVGKTGYTRVLKRVSRARTSEMILGNVREAAHGTPSADLSWTVDGVEASTTWSNEDGLFPLDRMDVFDTPSVLLHLDSDLTYSYTPADLSLFKYVAAGIQGVSERAKRALEAATRATPTFLSRYDRGTRVYPLIEALSAATELQPLRELAAVEDAEAERLPQLKETVIALQSDSVPAQTAVAKSRLSANKAILELTDALQAFDSVAYEQARHDRTSAVAQQFKLKAAISQTHAIPGAEDPTWHAFVESAEAYRAHLQLHDYPAEGDRCLYCRQALSPQQVAVIRSYQALLADTTQVTINNAERMLATLRGRLLAVDLGRLRETLQSQLPDDGADLHTDRSITLVADAVLAQEQLRGQGTVELIELLSGVPDISSEATRRVEASESLISDLAGKSAERAEKLREARAAASDLEARIRLKADLPEIEAFVGDAKWSTSLKAHQGRIAPVLTSLTNATKDAGELLLNRNFDALFEEERRALRAPAVVLDFPGKQGTTRRIKTVESHRPSVVLSEGEQKVIALADFLAESSLRGASSPVIFDDPVNSLDYRRIQEVSTRIAMLSRNRQVVIFTHNIWFATELLSRFEKQTDKCTYYSIEDDGALKGIVKRGSHPRWDTVKKLTGRVNAAIEAACAVEGEAREALVESAYSSVRSWIEVVVEQELLQHVVQRYQPNVALTMLPAIDGAKLDVAKAAMYPIYEKACRIIEGHSQPLETLSVRPKLDELEAEWTLLQNARTTYITR